jgi:hypothetical protein
MGLLKVADRLVILEGTLTRQLGEPFHVELLAAAAGAVGPVCRAVDGVGASGLCSVYFNTQSGRAWMQRRSSDDTQRPIASDVQRACLVRSSLRSRQFWSETHFG